MGLNLYFSTHEAEAITPYLRHLYDNADMVVIEQDFREDDDRNLTLLNELSQGNLLIDDVLKVTSGPYGQMHPDFTSGLLSMIYRSRKTILLEHSPYSVYEAQEQYALARQEYRDMPLAKSCRLLAENLAKRAENQRIRDESLATQLAEVVADHPSSNILVLRGFGHKPSLEKALASRNIVFTSVTSHEGLRGFLSDEVIQKIIERGRPTRRELLKALVEQAEIRTRSFQPTQASIRIVRGSVGAMSELQCEKYLRKKLNLT